jgi:hypothetical protein
MRYRIGVMVCVVVSFAAPAVAGAYSIEEHPLSESPWETCYVATSTDEAVVAAMSMEPANGATVGVGTPAVFSARAVGQSEPTFSVASSPALLSSPDVASGSGALSGGLYRFTAANATATPRTIYWTASFTMTPEGCESPLTLTTPVQTLIVASTEAERVLAASKQKHVLGRGAMPRQTAPNR